MKFRKSQTRKAVYIASVLKDFQIRNVDIISCGDIIACERPTGVSEDDKMKTTWSEEGLDGGRMVHRIKVDAKFSPSDPSAHSDSIYIVSYGRGDGVKNDYWLTSMADGMQLYKSDSLAELAEKMNEGNFHPLSGADKDKIIAAATNVAMRMR